jgi:Zn-dependent alcohol dehydrogenase
VKQIGNAVTSVQPGDPVLLSFASCRCCEICKSAHPSHCVKFNEINFVGSKDFTTSTADDFDISGSFFGQSSFSSLSIVREGSVVNAKDLIKNEDDLKLFAPLGCGIQTGSGSIVNVAHCGADDIVAVIGLGGVGLSGVMGAKVAGAKTIIGIDRVLSRLDLAKELGATHVISTDGIPMDQLETKVPELVKAVTPGNLGATIVLDTTGLPALIRAGLEFTRSRGQYIQVGTANPQDAKLEIEIFPFMVSGKRFIGAVEGDVIPQQYVPTMVQWYREGRFPVDRLVKYFKAEKFLEAIESMHTGEVVKPIIVW